MLDVESRRRSLVERLGHIRELLSQLESTRERLTDGAQQLLAALLELSDQVDTVLRDRWEGLGDLPADQRDELRLELCNDFHDVLQEFGHTLIPALEGASASSIPVELETTVQIGVSNSAQNWNLQAVLYGEHQYNYSIAFIKDPVGQYGRPLGVSSASSAGRADFVFLSLPRLERGSISLHAIILGHELGHLRDWYEGVSDGVDLPIPQEFLDEGGQLTTDRAAEVNIYRVVAANWVAETVADVISYLILGPAAALSLAELTATLGPIDADSLTHPAADRRLKIMLDMRDKRGPTGPDGLEGLLDDLGSRLGEPFARPALIRALDDQGPVELAWEWLRGQLPDLVTRCEQLVQQEELFAPDLAADVSAASELLARGRPCGELLRDDGSASVMRTRVILNAVWDVKARKLNDLAGHLSMQTDSSENVQRLSTVIEDLAAKSLEITARLRGRL